MGFTRQLAGFLKLRDDDLKTRVLWLVAALDLWEPLPITMMEDFSTMSLADVDASEIGDLPDPQEEFILKLLEELTVISQKYNGATRYLKAALATFEEKKDFGTYLWNLFEEASDTLYHHDADLPSVSEMDLASTQPLTVHVACLGFLAEQSPKPAAGHEATKVMMDMILKGGFQTGSEPLLVLRSHQPDMCKDLPIPWSCECPSTTPLPMFGLSYLKGLRRATSLMMILHYCKVKGVDIAKHLPEFFESVVKIRVHHVAQASLAEETFSCMKISAKGSMRRACNVVDMVVMIRNLGMDVNAFARRWNTGMAATFHIQGKRLMSLRLLLDKAPQDSWV